MTDVFIRQRPWCACGRSCNTATGQFEAGLSVYEAIAIGSRRWRPTGRAWKKWGTDALEGSSPWFLVSGTNLVGQGGDGEPLFESLKLIHHIVWNEDDACFEETHEEPSTRGDHDGYPACVCQGGLSYYQQLQDERYGAERDEDPGEEDEE